jgi:hypothetical protein
MSGRMKSVMFSFSDSVNEESQGRALSEIKALPGVRNVGRVSPQAKMPALRRMCFAEVDDNTADAVIGELREMQGIQSPEQPAPRFLIS